MLAGRPRVDGGKLKVTYTRGSTNVEYFFCSQSEVGFPRVIQTKVADQISDAIFGCDSDPKDKYSRVAAEDDVQHRP